MSQQFQADGKTAGASGTLAQNSETTLVTGNFVNPPYGNCKFIGSALANLTLPSGTTTMRIRVRRNPSGDNTVVYDFTVNVTASTAVSLSAAFADAVPDGRPCQYAVTATGAGMSTTGTFDTSCFIEATCLSG
jgi:hypothetical protein